VNRPYIMDLKEGRSIVANYVKAGYFSRHERSARM
jgi:poly(3-hydroxyalkanoate) synthetase